ncbi:MAG TPA: hypothetical protein DDZ51_23905 [Planctomycetaceae bacterium]|nr:hypothetical protein [Planctomycetaceae bacterium]
MPYCLSRSVISSTIATIALAILAMHNVQIARAQYPLAPQTQIPQSSAVADVAAKDRRPGTTYSRPAGRSSGADAINAIPMGRLTPAAQQRILAITNRPTLYRHLGQQTIQCDADLFMFIVRNPEVLVGVWDLMEITEVKTERIDAFKLRAIDGSGTDCTVDLVYGDPAVHVYVADGFYDGKLTTNVINGKGVFILRSIYKVDAEGNSIIEGSLDCFVQVEHLAADLIMRTFGPLIGRTADHNFAETARFIDQLGTTASKNPLAMEELALRLPQVSEPSRQRFAALIRQAAERQRARALTAPVAATIPTASRQ